MSDVKVKVKKRKFVQNLLDRKVVCYVYDIYETLVEGGSTTVNLYRVYNVIEIMDLKNME